MREKFSFFSWYELNENKLLGPDVVLDDIDESQPPPASTADSAQPPPLSISKLNRRPLASVSSKFDLSPPTRSSPVESNIIWNCGVFHINAVNTSRWKRCSSITIKVVNFQAKPRPDRIMPRELEFLLWMSRVLKALIAFFGDCSWVLGAD
uniref:Uncharacterized protein n=1 Tax=Kalanchoe fedtschenkoi TaxID=63787 RepID=A0A7N0SWJ0_KALFE